MKLNKTELVIFIIIILLIWCTYPRTKYETKLFEIRAYCPKECCCGNHANNITASNHDILPGDKFVAAPKEYAFGTLLLINEYSSYPVPVLDRGSAVLGNKLEVFFHTHQEAKEWGVKILNVTIIKEDNNGQEE